MRTLLLALIAATSACAGRYTASTVPTDFAFHDARGEAAVVARYMQGESLDQLASDLALADRDQARDVVHHAMIDLQKRYFHDH